MNKQKLLLILQRSQRFLHSQDFIPILQHFCFSNDKVIAYNDEQAIEYFFKTDLELALPGSILIKMLSTLENDVDISIFGKKNQVKLKSGKTELKLPFLPKEEFIFEFPDVSNIKGFVLNDGIIKGLERCITTSVESGTAKVGITWKVNEKVLTFYSTDNVTISKYECGIKNENNSDFLIITPTLFCQTLIDLYKNTDSEKATLYLNEDYAVVDFENECRIFTRLYDTSLALNFEGAIKSVVPDIKRILFSEIPTGLQGALSRSMLVYSPDLGANFEVNGTELKIDTVSNLGKSDDSIDLPFDSGSFTFIADPSLLNRALKVCDSISFQPNILVFQDESKNFLHLINIGN